MLNQQLHQAEIPIAPFLSIYHNQDLPPLILAYVEPLTTLYPIMMISAPNHQISQREFYPK